MSTQIDPKKPCPALKLSVMGYVPDGVIEKDQPLHICVHFTRSYGSYNPGEKAWLIRQLAEDAIKEGAARRALFGELSAAAQADVMAKKRAHGTIEVKTEKPEMPKAGPSFGNDQFKKAVKKAQDKYGDTLTKTVLEFYGIPTGRGRKDIQTSWGTVVLNKLIELPGLPEKWIEVPWFDSSMQDVYDDAWESILVMPKNSD